MEHLNYREEQMNAFKLKMASLTYFTIFSSGTSSNKKGKPNPRKLEKAIGWTGQLEEALSSFNSAGINFRNNPTNENSERYKAARALYYHTLLDKHDTIPMTVVSDCYL
ncbi:hypothetical protein Q4566_10140 [Tamlana sp. 2_MG-2023]|uniref:hypothetical protein n=1 Tax=unclassified Tamlana TaxID=2614803 RepID=UPI0026E3F076|nr:MULTISPECIES: hypothetical protein [unclassified Tamlana]MDO6760558.1 hypothetical protein [Tamlana sp. 2_MG-2023]MDO6790814.1 hypothetical protein [Tamlana sp. 1_MG-2023]